MKKRKNNVEAFMTFDEIAPIMGISRQRVQQIEAIALNKIRDYLFTRFGSSVTIEDILPILNKETHYEQMSVM